jgi:hypothetical protein
LQIQVPAHVASTAGLEIKRDGVVLGRSAWNVALPVDGGGHLLEASAPGKITWKASVQVKAESDQAVQLVPVLKAAPVPPPPPKPGLSTLEWAGIGTASAGVISLGISGIFLASALSKNADSKANCDGNACGTSGYDDRSSAVNHGNAATVLALVGGGLIAGGATLFVIGRTRRTDDEDSKPHGAVALSAGPGSLRAGYVASF